MIIENNICKLELSKHIESINKVVKIIKRIIFIQKLTRIEGILFQKL